MKTLRIFGALFVLAGVGCSAENGTDGLDGLSSIVSTSDEAEGANCANGGVSVSWGHDINSDGILNRDEIEGQSYICDGAPGETGSAGYKALVQIQDEPAGVNCSEGGKKITTVTDTNNDDVLQLSEVEFTNFICNGVQGPIGTNGLVSLVVQTVEDPGVNCTAGGVKIESGIDADNDLFLDANEIDSITYVCNAPGNLVRISQEAPGNNCIEGGTKIETGLDDGEGAGVAGDGVLDNDEVDETQFICFPEDDREGMLMQAADEDYFQFDALPGFMNGNSWSIIEMVRVPKIPSPTVGWHFFRGEAWSDLDGDVAIQVNTGATPPSVHVWVQHEGWVNVIWEDAFGDVIVPGRWLSICFQRAGIDAPLELWVDGIKRHEVALSGNVDDSGNTNPLYFGGQYVDPAQNQGDLYSEADIIIAHQAWLQRVLTDVEIAGYDGTNNIVDGTEVFTATIKQEMPGLYNFYNSVGDTFATIGNSPEYGYGAIE